MKKYPLTGRILLAMTAGILALSGFAQAQGKKAMSFTDVDWTSVFLKEDTNLSEEGIVARHSDIRLQSKLTSARLHAKLITFHNDSRTYIEEQGVNILYLALGFLHWFESESSEKKRKAPLLLIPVELIRSDVRERFRLSYTLEEIGSNLSLQEKLKSDFNIELPDIDFENGMEVDDYFDQIETQTSSMSRWELERNEIVLGFFSFGKFLMYKDLDSDTWPEQQKPSIHPVLSALMSEGFKDPAQTIPDDTNIDELISPRNINHVMDADSSQTLAIQEVNQGNNMVIQGPPGTGKSQTITNIIAEAVGNGKKILFVSEKMAALEVVKRRLDNIGIGDAALELHSYKMHKRKVLEELYRTLNLGKPIKTPIDDDIDTFTRIRDKLNNYCEAVSKPI